MEWRLYGVAFIWSGVFVEGNCARCEAKTANITVV
jgi:hypothetical protein